MVSQELIDQIIILTRLLKNSSLLAILVHRFDDHLKVLHYLIYQHVLMHKQVIFFFRLLYCWLSQNVLGLLLLLDNKETIDSLLFFFMPPFSAELSFEVLNVFTGTV